ncbi:MAG: SdrD B-like domain-containing protein, partial [Caldilinea sp.]
MYRHLTTGMQKPIAHTVLAMMLMLTLMLLVATPAMAVVPPQPSYKTAVIDGNHTEWNLTDDFFAYMHRAGNPSKPVESTLYLRYDCATSTGYALVLAQPGVDVLMQPNDAFVKLGNSTKLVDGNSTTFAWVQPNAQTGRAQGWEASFTLAPGSYSNLNVHTQVFNEESQTSAVADRSIPILIECPAVTPTPTETPTPSATPSTPTPTLNCENITVDYHRPLINGDHINMTIKSGGSEFQVNAYVDLNITGGYNGMGLRFSDGATHPLTQAEIDAGVIVWAYPTHASIVALNGAPFQVTFLQANQHDSWPTLTCSSEPTPTETPTPEPTPSATPSPTPTLTGPSFGSCYNPETQVFKLTVVNKASIAAYIGYDIYGQANSFVNLGRFEAGETKVFTVAQEGTLRKFISYDGQQWQQKGGTHVLSVAGHIANNLLCKGSVSACKFDDKNANGVQDADEPSISDWTMSIYAGAVEEGELPIASGVTNGDGFINFEKLLPGQYTVCEGQVAGWLPTISLCQPVTVLSEQETIVTFGNVRGGRIVVDKITDPAGAEDIFTFNLSKGAATITFTLTDSSAPFDSGLLFPGVYTIAELATEDWALTDVTCVSVYDETSVSELPNPVTISLQPGQLMQCTFTNTQEPTPEVTPEPTPEVTPEPTPEVTPEPTPEVTPEPTPEVTP